jgi:hypothetical protein
MIYCENSTGDLDLCDRLDLPKEMSLHEFNGTEHPLFDLDVLITASCGNGFMRKLAQHEVTVLQTSETDPLAAVKLLAAGERLPAAEPHVHDHSDQLTVDLDQIAHNGIEQD